jgi:gas vesicle protein
MARSLFDELRAQRAEPPPQPKLKPNVFARVSRMAWRQAGWVLCFWLAVFVASGVAAWRIYLPPASASLPLQADAADGHSPDSAFAALTGMQTITLSNAKAEVLQEQRDDLVAALRQRGDVFQLVFAPGAGDFYESGGLLYHPVDEVRGRVAYALSLKPLFNAIAEAPNAQSMATLVNEISAAIQQGRDPQGLDDLLVDSAASVQALMRGEDKPVDWSKLADLSEENTATSVTILAVPRAGQEATARSFTNKLLSVLQNSSDTVAAMSQPGIAPPKRATLALDGMRSLAALAMGLIFAALIVALGLGRMRLALVTFLPPVAFGLPLGFGLLLVTRSDWLAHWPLALGVFWMALVLGLQSVFAKVTYANGKKARESIVMLADHHHGQDSLWLAAIMAMPFAALVLATQGQAPAALALAGAVVALLMSMSLPTTLLRFFPEALQWRAGEWLVPAHRALFETGQWQWLARGFGAMLVLGCAAYLFVAPPHVEARKDDVPVSVVANNAKDADMVIKRLQAFSEAKAVRWLGMFLPADEATKREALRLLKDQFPRITPVLSEPPSDIRDQLDELQDSLKDIASTEQTKPRLKMAADEFRRSLALLAATSGDQQVRQLENRLFGGFNRLAERAEVLSSLPKPDLASLPDELHTLFGTPEGAMRIEVSPIDGVSNARLAEILEQADFNVLHPSVERDMMNRAVFATVSRVLAMSAFVGLLVVLLALRRLEAGVMAFLMAASAALVAFAVSRFWQVDWTFTNLLQAIIVISATLGFAWPAARHDASTAVMALELFLLPALALAFVLPFVALGVEPISQAIMPLGVCLFASAGIVGLLRQHRRVPEDLF